MKVGQFCEGEGFDHSKRLYLFVGDHKNANTLIRNGYAVNKWDDPNVRMYPLVLLRFSERKLVSVSADCAMMDIDDNYAKETFDVHMPAINEIRRVLTPKNRWKSGELSPGELVQQCGTSRLLVVTGPDYKHLVDKGLVRTLERWEETRDKANYPFDAVAVDDTLMSGFTMTAEFEVAPAAKITPAVAKYVFELQEAIRLHAKIKVKPRSSDVKPEYRTKPAEEYPGAHIDRAWIEDRVGAEKRLAQLENARINEALAVRTSKLPLNATTTEDRDGSRERSSASGNVSAAVDRVRESLEELQWGLDTRSSKWAFAKPEVLVKAKLARKALEQLFKELDVKKKEAQCRT
jgi:hypothetical protein